MKRFLPFLFIVIVWALFASPFLIKHKIPYPSDLQVNSSDLWSSYPKYWSGVYNPGQPDVISQIYPWKSLVIESWKNADVPLWNPNVFSGTPLLANYQSSAFSITNLFYFIFDFNIAWSLTALSPPLLAGIFMYLYIKSLRLREVSSLVASLSFMFCGFITVWLSYTTLSLAICFLPLALLAIEKYEKTELSRYLFLLWLTFPLSLFSGHFQTSLYFIIIVLGYTLFKYLEDRKKGNLFNYLLFVTLGILSASIQIIPSIELYLNSVRSSIFQKISPLSLTHLPTIVAPDFYGNPVTRNNILANYAEQTVFFGTIPFLLALYSIFMKNVKVYFFLLIAVISLILSINSPIADLFVNLKIPVLSTASLSRILVLVSFSGSVLAAFGISKLEKDLSNEKYKDLRIWIFICLIVFALTFAIGIKIINPIFSQVAVKNTILPVLMFSGLIFAIGISVFRKKYLQVTLLIILLMVTFDMLRFAIKWQPFGESNLLFPKTPIIEKLITLDKTYRTIGPLRQEGYNYLRIPGTDGYDPLYINRYGEFIEGVNGKIKSSGRVGTSLPFASINTPKAIELLGVKYVLIKNRDINKPWSFPINKYPPSQFTEIYKEKDFTLLENKNALPKAILVGNYEVEQDKQKIVDKIFSKDFDIKSQSILEKDPGIKQTDVSGSVIITNYSPNQIDLKVNSDNEGLVIINDNYYPGWKANVNGKLEEVRLANYSFRGIKVPAGESNIKVYYEPDSFRLGLVLSAFSILAVGLILGRKWYTVTHGKTKNSSHPWKLT